MRRFGGHQVIGLPRLSQGPVPQKGGRSGTEPLEGDWTAFFWGERTVSDLLMAVKVLMKKISGRCTPVADEGDKKAESLCKDS